MVKIYRIAKRLLHLLLVVVAGFFAASIYVTKRGPPLTLWHTYVPHEMKAAELDKPTGTNFWPKRPGTSDLSAIIGILTIRTR